MLSTGTFSIPDIDLHLADWAAIAQIALALIAIAALIGAVMQIREARNASRVALTYNYTERFSESTSQHLSAAYALFDLKGKTVEEKFSAFLQWEPSKQLEALVVPNLIEEIAGMYNHRLLHAKIAEDFFGILAAEMWAQGAWFIDLYRGKTDDDNFYRQWECMLISIGRAQAVGIPT